MEIVADIASTLWEINEKIGEELKFNVPEYIRQRKIISNEIGLSIEEDLELSDIDREAAEASTSDSFPLKPQRILRDLRSIMNDDDILISDVGAHKMWVARHYPAFQGNTCIISNGFCSMGIALPGAISAKMVHPDKNIVGLCGDGGFLMNVQEIATAVKYNIPAVILIWEDGEYGLITWKQENQFGTHSYTDFTNPDFVELSKSFGAYAERVESADNFIPAMKRAFAQTDRPSVIIVPVDYSENKKLTERLGRLLSH